MLEEEEKRQPFLRMGIHYPCLVICYQIGSKVVVTAQCWPLRYRIAKDTYTLRYYTIRCSNMVRIYVCITWFWEEHRSQNSKAEKIDLSTNQNNLQPCLMRKISFNKRWMRQSAACHDDVIWYDNNSFFVYLIINIAKFG